MVSRSMIWEMGQSPIQIYDLIDGPKSRTPSRGEKRARAAPAGPKPARGTPRAKAPRGRGPGPRARERRGPRPPAPAGREADRRREVRPGLQTGDRPRPRAGREGA